MEKSGLVLYVEVREFRNFRSEFHMAIHDRGENNAVPADLQPYSTVLILSC